MRSFVGENYAIYNNGCVISFQGIIRIYKQDDVSKITNLLFVDYDCSDITLDFTKTIYLSSGVISIICKLIGKLCEKHNLILKRDTSKDTNITRIVKNLERVLFLKQCKKDGN